MRGAQTVDGVLHPEALPFADCHPLTRARIADEIGKVEGVEDQPVRGDFVSELKHPIKRRIGIRYSNEFYFVTPAALVSAGEIPSECGRLGDCKAHEDSGAPPNPKSRTLLHVLCQAGQPGLVPNFETTS